MYIIHAVPYILCVFSIVSIHWAIKLKTLSLYLGLHVLFFISSAVMFCMLINTNHNGFSTLVFNVNANYLLMQHLNNKLYEFVQCCEFAKQTPNVTVTQKIIFGSDLNLNLLVDFPQLITAGFVYLFLPIRFIQNTSYCYLMVLYITYINMCSSESSRTTRFLFVENCI